MYRYWQNQSLRLPMVSLHVDSDQIRTHTLDLLDTFPRFSVYKPYVTHETIIPTLTPNNRLGCIACNTIARQLALRCIQILAIVL